MSGTKIRPLSRLLDASDAPLWVIDADGQLIYLSAGIETWLQLAPDRLLGRRCVAGSPLSDDPLDQIAASLSPPPGFTKAGTASLRLAPTINGKTSVSMEVRFLRIGEVDASLTLGVAGSFDDRVVDVEVQDAVAIRQRIDDWRKWSAGRASIATDGIIAKRASVAASDASCLDRTYRCLASGAARLRQRIDCTGNT